MKYICIIDDFQNEIGITTASMEDLIKKPLVIKFGGSTIKQLNFPNLVEAISNLRQSHNSQKVICILSAIENQTRDLMLIADSIGPGISGPPRDALLTTGENMSVAEAWLAAESLGVNARGVSAWQIGIRTTSSIGGKSFIKAIDSESIFRMLQDTDILFVTGYQGISPENNIVTLCRGGSDVTAIAIAASLDVDECLICTDKEGIHEIDPRLGFEANILEEMSYDQAIELGWLGMKIIHPRATVIAKRHGIGIRIVHDMNSDKHGTLIHKEKNKEKPVLAVSRNETLFELRKYNNSPGILASIYEILCDTGLDIDLFYQGPEDIFFVVNTDDINGKVLQDMRKELKGNKFSKDVKKVDNLTKVSVVTKELAQSPGITNEIIKRFIVEKIDFNLLGGPRNRLSVVTDEASSQNALRLMYEMFIEEPII